MLGGTERDRHLHADRQHLAVRRRRRASRCRSRTTAPRAVRDYPVPAHSRVNVPVRDDFPQAMGRRFGTLVESQGSLPAQLVVERAMYSDSGRSAGLLAPTRWAHRSAQERVITITPQGVTPRVLVVSPGERITVRNLDTTPHQIFSGPVSRTLDLSGPEPGRLPRSRRITRVGQLQHRGHVPVPGRRPAGTAAESRVPGVRHRALTVHGQRTNDERRTPDARDATLEA